MASQVSSENLPRLLRIPAFVRERVPSKLETVPLSPKDLNTTDRGTVYGIRLRDTFFSAAHAFAIERGWVKSAMLHSAGGMITHSPGKDSLLLLWGINPSVRRYSTEHIEFIDPSLSSRTLTIDLDDEEDSTFAVQADNPKEVEIIMSMTGATVFKYKNYVALKVPSSEADATISKIRSMPSARLIPHQVLTGADPKGLNNCVTIQLAKTHEVSILKHLFKDWFCYSPNNGQLRIYGIKDDDTSIIESIKAIQGVQSILSATTMRTLASNNTKPKKDTANKSDEAQQGKGKKGNMIVVKRIDATPISSHTAELLVKLLNLSKASVRDGALLGLTPDAQALSGTLLNGKFLIAWEMEM